MKKISTRQLVYLAFLVSLNVVLTRIASIRIPLGGIDGIRIGFGDFPVIFAGLLFGPAAGGIVGTVGDLVGYYINPMGAYMPHFTLTSALTGIIPAALLSFTKKNVPSFWQLLIAIGIGQITAKVILLPYFLQITFNMPMNLLMPARIISQGLNILVFSIVAEILLKRTDIAFY